MFVPLVATISNSRWLLRKEKYGTDRIAVPTANMYQLLAVVCYNMHACANMYNRTNLNMGNSSSNFLYVCPRGVPFERTNCLIRPSALSAVRVAPRGTDWFSGFKSTTGNEYWVSLTTPLPLPLPRLPRGLVVGMELGLKLGVGAAPNPERILCGRAFASWNNKKVHI